MSYTNPEIQWLKLLGRWLLQVAPKPPKPLLIYERRTEELLESKLSLLADSDSRFQRPGAVATWLLVDRQEPTVSLFVSLDNLLRLAAEAKEIEIKRGLERSQGLTHRFQASWVLRSSVGQKFHFIIIEAFDIDLANQYIDEAPREILRHLMLDIFNMRPVPGLKWKERIYNFPWIGTIEYFSSKKGCPTSPRYRRLCKRIQKVTFS